MNLQQKPIEPTHFYIKIGSSNQTIAIRFTRNYLTLIQRLLYQVQEISDIKQTDILGFEYECQSVKSLITDTSQLKIFKFHSNPQILNCIVSTKSIKQLSEQALKNKDTEIFNEMLLKMRALTLYLMDYSP